MRTSQSRPTAKRPRRSVATTASLDGVDSREARDNGESISSIEGPHVRVSTAIGPPVALVLAGPKRSREDYEQSTTRTGRIRLLER